MELSHDLLDRIKDVGFSDNEAKVLLSTMSLPTAPASRIAQRAGLNRVTTYSLLEKFIAKGTVSTQDIGGVKHFSAPTPEAFISDVQMKANALSLSLPALKALKHGFDEEPVTRFYKGMAAVKRAYDRSLEAEKEILNYSHTQHIRKHWSDHDATYVAARVEAGIRLRGLVEADPDVARIRAKDKESMREMRILPDNNFPIENEINIWDDKVLITSFEPRPFAILITSQSVADTQRQIFEVIWKLSKSD